ncbi:hypothetical protein P0082_02225 [Candidatus Haliotispira prima]|uniref:Uncharacterized protein n=1 Tax=Candidatus Haliotispira prima TaxID=3034016 RepID=A0ABY8MJB9_9SPIO|nr:hypothetical protein P0082_02225 [Candidatus Haliotispira prima]
MKLSDLWQSSIDLFKRDNPLTSKFVFWYFFGIVGATMLLVAYQVIPMIRETMNLNQQIQEGKVYIQGQNPILNPDIDDFVLPGDGTFQLKELHPLRPLKESWSSDELQKYWDDVDQKKLKELRQENRRMLRNRLQSLP